jgi:exonuclease III
MDVHLGCGVDRISRKPKELLAMKIVTWNCQQAFEKKAERIFSGSPDIAVIQECSKKSAERPPNGYVAQWVGGTASKGLGVFCREDWSLRRLGRPKEDDPKWIVPFRVEGAWSFILIAVWACAVKGNQRESYVGQIHRALRERAAWFKAGPIVMTGDFNSNAIFDKKRRQGNHTSMVDRLKKYGLESAYHSYFKQEHGVEEMPTFHLYRRAERPYHFDYLFLPVEWLEGMKVEVGSHEGWACASDHCPLTVQVSPIRPLNRGDVSSALDR